MEKHDQRRDSQEEYADVNGHAKLDNLYNRRGIQRVGNSNGYVSDQLCYENDVNARVVQRQEEKICRIGSPSAA